MSYKKVYIPTIDELAKMQSILKCKMTSDYVTIFDYCMAKKIEYIVANGGLEFFGEEEKNDYNVVRGVLKYIPSDIWCTLLNTDEYLFSRVICSNITKKTIYGLDYLGMLPYDLNSNNRFIQIVIDQLNKNIQDDPSYRFDYVDSKVLDAIFNRKLGDISGVVDFYNKEYYLKLMKLEPSYILDFNKFDMFYSDHSGVIDIQTGNNLKEVINSYEDRFGVSNLFSYNYQYEDVASPNSEYCKKLVRFLEEHR